MKKIFIIPIVFVFILLSSMQIFAKNSYKDTLHDTIITTSYESNVAILDDNRIELSNKVFIENEQVMLPVRAVCEALGYTVWWDAWYTSVDWYGEGWDYKVVASKKGQIPYVFIIDYTSMIIEGRTYIPLGELAEILDDSIVWDDNLKIVRMKRNTKNDRVKSYNVENEAKLNNINYGYLPQIINPHDGEYKINESILKRLNDEVYDKETVVHLVRNDYRYKITNDKNNVFSVSYDRISTFDDDQYTSIHAFGDTFYKDTGKKLQIKDILKGSKEDIENILIESYYKGGWLKLKNTVNHDYCPWPDWEPREDEDLINDYDFYIEDDNLVIIFDSWGGYTEGFKINISDNANLFQEEFLKNLNNYIVGVYLVEEYSEESLGLDSLIVEIREDKSAYVYSGVGPAQHCIFLDQDGKSYIKIEEKGYLGEKGTCYRVNLEKRDDKVYLVLEDKIGKKFNLRKLDQSKEETILDIDKSGKIVAVGDFIINNELTFGEEGPWCLGSAYRLYGSNLTIKKDGTGDFYMGICAFEDFKFIQENGKAYIIIVKNGEEGWAGEIPEGTKYFVECKKLKGKKYLVIKNFWDNMDYYWEPVDNDEMITINHVPIWNNIVEKGQSKNER